MNLRSTLLLPVLFTAIPALANDSCQLIVKRTAQASFPSQEEYSVSSLPRMVSETDPKTGTELYETWIVKANEGSEEGAFSTTIVTMKHPGDSLANGCKVVGIF